MSHDTGNGDQALADFVNAMDSMPGPFDYPESEDVPTIWHLLEKNIARGEYMMRESPLRFLGEEWWQFTWAEAEVFHIDPALWPRQVLTLDCFDNLQASLGTAVWPQHLMDRLAAADPGSVGRSASRNDFLSFGSERAGLGNRDAAKVYELMRIRHLPESVFEDEEI